MVFLLLSLELSSCGWEVNQYQDSRGQRVTYEIDPLFNSLNSRLEGICGEGISPMFLKGGKQYQYTVGCLFVYNPEESPPKRLSLYPLGRRWVVEEPPEPPPDPAVADQTVYLNGHYVWEELISLYVRVGAPLIGRPLTEVRFNAERNQYEQFFENMGFYRKKDDPVGAIKVMRFGSWMCGKSCLGNRQEYEFGIPATPPFTPVALDLQQAESAMFATMDRLGRDFIGSPVSEIYQAADGMYEKIFQNCVMFIDPRDPSRVQFRPLPLILNFDRHLPVGPSQMEGMYFYPVLGQDLGYNIYYLLFDYITLHGTMEVFGPPIGELYPAESGISRQCFTYFCLEYHSKAPKSLQIRPAALGLLYRDSKLMALPPTEIIEPPLPTAEPITEVVEPPLSTPEPTVEEVQPQIVQEATPVPTVTMTPEPILQATPTPRHISGPLNIQVWERYAALSPSDNQEIGVALMEDNQPLSDIGFSLTVTYPDGSQKYYVMPLTGANGVSTITLDKIDAPLGTIILYQVCITNLLDLPVCVKESFIIWGGE